MNWTPSLLAGLRNIRGRSLYYLFLHVALIGLAGEVIYLTAENNKLKGGFTTQSSRRTLQVGDSLILGDLKQVYGPLSPSSAKECLYFIYTTKCHFCMQSLSAWNRIDSIIHQAQITTKGVCLDSLQQCVQHSSDNRLRFAVFVPGSAIQFREHNHITGVPATILVSGSGGVKRLWFGALNVASVQEVTKAIPY